MKTGAHGRHGVVARTAIVVCVLCMFGAACRAEDVASVTKGMRRAMGQIRSVGARLTVTTHPFAGYVAALNLEPGQALQSRRQLEWWQKGSMWRVDEHRRPADGRAGGQEEITTFLFAGDRTLVYTKYQRPKYTRGAFVEAETPNAYAPLDQAYHIRGREAPYVLESDAFKVIAVENHPSWGRICRLEGHEFGKSAFTTTVLVALDRGCQIVSKEFRSNRMGKVVTVDRTEAMKQAGGIWLPSRIVRELRYPGRECTVTIDVEDIHVNDVPNARFEARLLGRGTLFDRGVPLAIQSDGMLGLDRAVGVRSAAWQHWPQGLLRLGLALVVFMSLWMVVVRYVRGCDAHRHEAVGNSVGISVRDDRQSAG